jgi:ketosteroid isomerase-like protein
MATREQVQEWLDRYVEAWRSYDEDAIRALFAPDAEYSFHPYDPEPEHGHDAIVKAWRKDPDEAGSWAASYSPVLIEGDRAIAKGRTRYSNDARPYWNLFELEFDADGRCTRFVEWFMQPPS